MRAAIENQIQIGIITKKWLKSWIESSENSQSYVFKKEMDTYPCLESVSEVKLWFYAQETL